MYLTHPSLWHLSLILVSNVVFRSQALLQSAGSTKILNGVPYFVPPQPVTTLQGGYVPDFSGAGAGLLPMTVVTTDLTQYGQADLDASSRAFTGLDDVWQSGFLEVLYLQYNGTSPASFMATIPGYVSSGNVSSNSSQQTLVVPPPYSSAARLPNGPYFLDPTTKTVYSVYQLYSDFQEAFTETLIPAANDSFTVLPANIPGQQLAVAVPSRLYYTATNEKPLAGVRLGVKDIYDVAGVRTGQGNRARYMFYPPATVNSVPVQRLVDAGVVVVGKMKTSQFANGQTATDDWIDQIEPFNPRGDGYQDTSSSSSGPGAGAAAYPWLDITLGSDTGGSIRGPSQEQGLFGNRPSHGLVPLTGVMPLAPELDTSGFLLRDPTLWSEAAQVLYGGLQTYTQFPTEILTIDFPTNNSGDSNRAILNFLNSLQTLLSASVTPYNITEDFATSTPSDSPTTSVDELLNITYPILISQEQTRLVRDPFYADYAARYDGRRPFVDPAPLIRWAFGDMYPPSALTDAVTNKTIFQNWIAENVLRPDSATCSDKLLLYVGSDAGTVYRNVYRSAPTAPTGFSEDRISVFAEVPDFVVPVGEAGYFSNVTMHEEVLPVTVDLLAAKGCDGMLFALVERLLGMGVVRVSETGRSLESGGDVLFKRGDDVGA